MASYISETALREMTTGTLRSHAPSVLNVRLETVPGPYRPGNWRIVGIDVLAEDYGAARDVADRLEQARNWVLVPDRHFLDGQVYGDEFLIEPNWDGPGAPSADEAVVHDPREESVLREIREDIARMLKRLRGIMIR